jgi:hypothetical protein
LLTISLSLVAQVVVIVSVQVVALGVILQAHHIQLIQAQPIQ